jgi:hypothetical protein
LSIHGFKQKKPPVFASGFDDKSQKVLAVIRTMGNAMIGLSFAGSQC